MAGADWDNSRHDGIFAEGEHGEEEGIGDEESKRVGGKGRFDTKAKDVNGVELVTVPALGPEYVPPDTALAKEKLILQSIAIDGGKTKPLWARAASGANCKTRNANAHGRSSRGTNVASAAYVGSRKRC